MNIQKCIYIFYLLTICVVIFVYFDNSYFTVMTTSSNGLTFISNIASVTGIISFVLLLPFLIIQNDSDKKMLTDIDKNVKENLKELRRIDSPDEGFKCLKEWVNRRNRSETDAVIYVSKLSVVPGFWLTGDKWVTQSLKYCEYPYLIFAGPKNDAKQFTKLTEAAIEVANNSVNSEHTGAGTERMNGLKGKDASCLTSEYNELISVLKKKKIKVIELDDTALEKSHMNFVLRKRPQGHSLLNSPWQMIFFDDANILSGIVTTPDEEHKRVFIAPEIYSSENAALGHMFHYIAKGIHPNISCDNCG